MSDRVFVSNLCVHGFHGLFPEERKLGQKLFLDIDCETDLAAAARTDDYEQTVCYAKLCQTAVAVSKARRYKLIEALAERMADEMFARFPAISKIRLTIRKPSAPMAYVADHVGIEITRHRNTAPVP